MTVSFRSFVWIASLVGATALSTLSTTSPTKALSSSIPALAGLSPTDRLPYLEEGYATWKWRGHNINYLEVGDPQNPPLLLIHGFGASAYHFRHNILDLAVDHHVYAMDLLGFGGSDKPVQSYGAAVWRDQAVDFMRDVMGGQRTIVAGNSLGGFTALYAAASAPEVVAGCISLNGAGYFRDLTAKQDDEKSPWMQQIQTALQRLVIEATFWYTKQPARIEQVLRQVYPVNAANVDDELIRSIRAPSFHPNAAEVFYRVITKTAGGKQPSIDELLAELTCPLLLCWGEEDPWIRSVAADKMQALYPHKSKRVSINAGHCPHDEAPEAVNSAIRNFVQEVA